jgi:hypothetical protein
MLTLSSYRAAEGDMKRLLGTIAVAACIGGIAPVAFSATGAECAAEWTKADVNNDGVLSGVEASRYLAFLRIRAQVLPDDGRITQAKFIAACKGGLFTAATSDPGAPLKGSTSFSEAQAKDHVMAAGYTDVSTLTKDDSGIWRGGAKMGDRSVKVAVDYKGNVVSQ